MEASALQAPATLPQTAVMLNTPLLRFRSDEQLVALFRAGHDEAFRAIHERYHKRLFAYARQMLHVQQDAEDAAQDVFVRAYSGLRASNHDLALRAWLFRVAHNRCIDELRRPAPPPPEVLQLVRATISDPLAEVDRRESLRRLIEDIRRLPEQQRSALLMRELAGMSYADLAASLGISIGAVKSLLVRARVALAQAAEARDTSCVQIREQLVEAHDRGLRPNANTRKHMRDCVGCKSFRRELRGMSRQLAAVAPAVGPLAVLAKTLGFSGGAGGGAAGGGGLALLGGGGATATAGGLAVGVNHVAALLAAAVATAGGAVEIQHSLIAPAHHPARAHAVARHHSQPAAPAPSASTPSGIQAIARDVEATVSSAPRIAASADPPVPKARPQLDAMAGGPVNAPPTAASSVSPSSATRSASAPTEPKTGGSATSPAAKTTCSSVISAVATTNGTGSTPSSASDTAGAPPTGSAQSTPATCVMSSSSSSATSTSSNATNSSSAGNGTSGTSSTSSTSASNSGGSTPAAGSDPSSAGASSTGGSPTAAK